MFALHAYLVEIAMLCKAVRLERCDSIDFIFSNAETLLTSLMVNYTLTSSLRY